MKKIVFLNGLLSGLIITATMLTNANLCYNDPEFKGNMLLGFGSMLLSFSLIFVGIKNYRDRSDQGALTFGKAFLVGLYITLVSSTLYVVAWLIDYYIFMPEFIERYADHMIGQAKNSPEEVSRTIKDMETYKSLYKTPFGVIAATYMEVVPIGLGMSLIAAFVFKGKIKKGNQAAT